MQKGQLVLGVGTIVLALILFFGGKTVLKKEKNAEMTHTTVESISFEDYEAQQIKKLMPSEVEQVNLLKSSLKSLQETDTTARKKILHQLSDFWKNLDNRAIGAYYHYQQAEVEGSKHALEDAGDILVNVYKSGADSIISNNLITFALRSYNEAVQKDSNDIGLKLKLADVYVQGSSEPMKGISMLKELEQKHPDNIQLQIALGRLSIQSGQLDKAKERFKKVLQLEPQNTEALYFMAITEAQLGHTDEATRMFEMCKIIVNNEEFSKEIDEIVKSLKK